MQIMGAMTTRLFIKNMVCPRCIRVVGEELHNLGLNIEKVELGEVEIHDDLTPELTRNIKLVLEKNGFELLEDRKRKIVEKIKIAIIDLLYNSENRQTQRITLSAHLSDKLKMDYNYLSTLFSSIENITIEKYLILQKVERVKELLRYEQLTTSEIAYRLNYSSTQHLSNQFRQITGMSPTQFRKMVKNNRKPIDQLT
jgi:AraC family transcriptional regulator